MNERIAAPRRLRRLWLRLHRWTALALGGVLILSGLTGAALVVARPLDRWLHSDYFVADDHPSSNSVTLESIRAKLATEFGARVGLTFRPSRESNETLQVLVRGAWRGTVYLNPKSGREQGRRGDDDGLVNIMYRVHSSLWMGQAGKALLALAAAAYMVLLTGGLILWWPRRWPPNWRIELRKGLLRGLFDLHRTGGVVMGMVIAVSVATGAFLAWRPIGGWITALSNESPTPIPILRPMPGPMLPLDDLAARAQAVFPGGLIGYIMIPPQPHHLLRIRIRTADDPHPNGQSVVWLDSSTGVILASHRWNRLDPGKRANAVIYPLHTGELGGPLLQAVNVLVGLVLGAIGTSGLWLWWRRRAFLAVSRRRI